MNSRQLRRVLFFCVSVPVLLSLFSCNKQSNPTLYSGLSPTSTRTTGEVALVKPADAGELEKRVKAELTRRYERLYASYVYRGTTTGAVRTDTTAGGQAAGTPSGTGTNGAADATPHSDTNVQEKGVDEGDLVKTDGKFIYLARGTRFFILRADPATDSAILSDMDLMEQISELYLSGSIVVIVTMPVTVYPVSGGTVSSATVIPYRPITHLYIYDVSAPEVPILTASFDFPGYAKGSRRIGNTLYLITNTTVDLPVPALPSDYLSTGTTSTNPQAFITACDKARQENLKRIESASLADLLPAYKSTVYSGGTGSSSSSATAAPGTTYIADPGNGTDMSLVASVDLTASPPSVSTSTVMTASSQIYMSPTSLYLASTNSWFWIEPLIGFGMPESNPEPGTTVHKFSIDGSGTPVYRGSGSVDGWINDRFSMGEHQGFLRLGTTRGGWWGETISNQLVVLGEDSSNPKQLAVVGAVKDLAPGERIYSMRFDRDRGYMVTFKQTDPLFTLDLKDPRSPRVAGNVKVNGFATYIHLLGTDLAPRLLTIGRSADSSGRVTGNKLQLFDVGALASPRLAGEYELGSGWSEALYDPHAFLYYEPLGILNIPYYAYGTGTGSYSSGLSVFMIGSNSISLKGTIPAPSITTGYGPYKDTVDRSVIIGSAIFSIAHRSVTAAGSDQLNIIKTIQLPEGFSFFSGSATLPSQPISTSAN